MNIELVELLENLTNSSRNTKELLEYGDQIKVSYKGAEIICFYKSPEAGMYQQEEIAE
jgi:hypothetical protein